MTAAGASSIGTLGCWRTPLACAATGLAALAWAMFATPLPRVTYNPSDSVAVGWYRVERLDSRRVARPVPLRVGSIVLVALPAPAATLAAQRGYLPTHVPLLKRVAAIWPQQVCLVGDTVRIDGEPQLSCWRTTGWDARCRPGVTAAGLNLANCSS